LEDPFYLLDLYRKRVRIRIRILDENFYSKGSPGLSFEIENIGLTPTSIEPIVLFSGYLPRPQHNRDGKITLVRYDLAFDINDSLRILMPHTPVQFDATNGKCDGRELAPKLRFMFFKTYTFSFTRGRKHKVRLRSADRVQLSYLRYIYERLDFALRGARSLPESEPRESE